MAQQHINLGTPPNGTDGDANRTAWLKAEANFDELYAGQTALSGQIAGQNTKIADVSEGLILGLKLEWLNAAAIRITSGSAHIEGEGELITLPAAATRSGLTLSANAWYHVYLFLDGATANVELSTTGPAAPYIGSARSKSGDTSRRYIGSLRTDASGAIRKSRQSGSTVYYSDAITGTGYRVLANGQATASTSVDLSGLVPVTATGIIARLTNTATNTVLFYPQIGVGTDALNVVGQNVVVVQSMPIANQACAYFMSGAPGTGGAYYDIQGYEFER